MTMSNQIENINKEIEIIFVKKNTVITGVESTITVRKNLLEGFRSRFDCQKKESPHLMTTEEVELREKGAEKIFEVIMADSLEAHLMNMNLDIQAK